MAHEEYDAKCMMGKPITELGKLIGANWFRPLDELSVKAGVPMRYITMAIHGSDIPSKHVETLKGFFKTL